MTMDNSQAVALIERAERETPFCDCGEPTIPVAHSRQVWLECASRQTLPDSTVRRFLATLAAASHTRRLILDPA
jgi:hypothetical protein